MKNTILIIFCSFLTHQLFSQNLKNEFDILMSEKFKENSPGAVAMVVKNDKILYRKAFGMANLELDVEMKPDNVFRIGSITKQFTAAAILKLRDEGKLKLEDEITKYIEDYPVHGHKITIKHLLTHTSGIMSYTRMKEWDNEVHKKDFTPKELIDYFKNQPMNFKPGEEWKYNDSAYFILGYVIEVVSGKTYEDYIDTNFFKPLNMTNSYYGSTSRIIQNRAYGYGKRNDSYINDDFLSMTQPYAAGSLLSTVDDLYKWYSAVMEDKVISAASRKEAHATYLLNNGKETGYGYGWIIGNIQGSPMIAHNGSINGYRTHSIYLSEEKVFVAIFTNCRCNYPDYIAKKIAAVAIGKPIHKIESINLNDLITDKYLGKYELSKNFKISIFKDKKKMFIQGTGQNKFEIIPFEKNKFSLVGIDAKLTFNMNEHDEVTSLTLHQGGNQKAKKIE